MTSQKQMIDTTIRHIWDFIQGIALTIFGFKGHAIFGEIPIQLPYAEILNYTNGALDVMLTVFSILFIILKIKLLRKGKNSDVI